MKRLWKAAIAAAGVAVMAGPILAASPAGATPPTGYGFDNTSHVIVGGGSDTTYHTQLDLSAVWNVSQKNGCVLNTAVGPSLGNCVTTGSPETNTLVNYQHDNVSQAPDVGSSAGIAALNGIPGCGADGRQLLRHRAHDAGRRGQRRRGDREPPGLRPFVAWPEDQRRSSRSDGNELRLGHLLGLRAGRPRGDGLQRTRRTGAGSGRLGAITPNELYHIWNCDFTQWSQIPSLAHHGGERQRTVRSWRGA